MAMTYLLASILAIAASGSPGLGEAFLLRVGESVSIEGAGLGLRFTDVPSDSRCPRNAFCVVAGEAHVVVEAEFESESVTILFRVPPAGSDTQRLARFTLTVTALEPQTDSNRRIEASDYVATMVVTTGRP